MSYNEMMEHMQTSNVQWDSEVKKAKIGSVYQLPFVHVYERSDFSTTLYGLQIYPETIREALLKKSLNPHVTGKFSMTTSFDDEQNQYLEIHIELKKDSKESGMLADTVAKEIFEHLRQYNSEFRELSNHLKERARPKINLWPAEHPTHFKPGGKQKWIHK